MPTHVNLLYAKDGEEAVEMVKTKSDISLVLMDIKMPNMDGYTATRIIKNLQPKLPVIAQTAYAMSEDKQKSLEAGFDDYVSKPIVQEKFIKVIGTYILKKS